MFRRHPLRTLGFPVRSMEITQSFMCLILFHLVLAKAANLFLSIDCGTNGSYNDPLGYTWLGDTQFVQTGMPAKVRTTNPVSLPLTTLRYFPTGVKNCYTISGIAPGSKTMVRASFYYGNYDGLSSPPAFDLVLDANLWATITTSLDQTITQELVYITEGDKVSICVARSVKNIVPFISSLDVRVVDQSCYKGMDDKHALFILSRQAFGSAHPLRYPDDIYDRVWLPYTGSPGVISITSQQTAVNNTAGSLPPTAAMLLAITPASVNGTTLSVPMPTNMPYETKKYFSILYFSEVMPNASRAFSIVVDGDVALPELIPPWGSVVELDGDNFALSSNSTITLVRKPISALPPLINAAELFLYSDQLTSGSDATNVRALKELQSSYPQLQAYWSGDPCLPVGYNWEWLSCSSDPAPQVIALFLSGYGLSGTLTDFSALTYLEIIDLHNNSLSGRIPDFLGRFPYLKELNLADNHFNGSLPASLVNNPQIKLNISGNDFPVLLAPSDRKRHINPALIAGPVAGGIVLLCLAGSIIFLAFRRTPRTPMMKQFTHDSRSNNCQRTARSRFTYAEISAITENFASKIGSGGSGDVYHGRLENDHEVAVKVINGSHPRGAKYFEAEVKLLMAARHRCLALCVGYCDEGTNLILLYEYMPNGNLRELLSGKHSMSGFLTWEKRLEVALSVATALDYLHTGCQPPMIHRDVKATNILLDENLEAKLADFGLCRVGKNDEVSLLSTVVAGTPGYIDPEYYTTFNLTRKSDVYSLGVVLFELITGRPPIFTFGKRSASIVQWAREMITEGEIDSMIDSKLGLQYDVNSVRKVVDLAFLCTTEDSRERPAMVAVMTQLKDAIDTQRGKQSTDAVTKEVAPSSSSQDSNSYTVFMPRER